MFTAFSAMLKVFCVSAVGFLAAKYPTTDPLLPLTSLRTLARLSNFIFLPCAIMVALGSTLSASLLSKLSILIVFAFLINIISYVLVYSFGKCIYDGDNITFVAICVAVGSPNAISFPILVMQTLCDQAFINEDYHSDSAECFDAASSMLFVYSIGWHIMFWTYGYPVLESIHLLISLEPSSTTTVQTSSWKQAVSDFRGSLNLISGYIRTDSGKYELRKWLMSVLFSPSMISMYIGIFIGMISALQRILFTSSAPLYSIGSVLITLGQPLVCVNTLVMSASLAHIQWKRDTSNQTQVPLDSASNPLHKLPSDDIRDGENISSLKYEPLAATFAMPELVDDHEQHSLPNWKSVLVHNMCR
jgi:hypothetical protein